MPRITKKSRIQDYVRSRGWSVIGESEWVELRAALPDISESTIRSAGMIIAQPWMGVVQHSFAELESSLCEMAEVYGARPDLRRYCRQQVIEARDRAKFLAASGRIGEEKSRIKSEMAEWMLVWLGDPAMFRTWVLLRRAKIDSCSTT